ncbi:uncharacterized protein Z519_06742 [Cladophialophora bantiana CBS 173.52]|uniref:Uncharacterized protein n=1 Tax=Cladophialophora bantiana (strain ATCC 10958 / CBS 173.52 / CDC B-1940 / NIH 8579) TaxID=1442370 RepID=A0A0D2HI04_CLAB1|nr:uncharacterized protein Z519_06742 [Cladophialophora bantiana CBS 173.52]KIW92893.1 hypothetical protein Z519_06742 [Cladophialophora bantiana CBS 173.52]
MESACQKSYSHYYPPIITPSIEQQVNRAERHFDQHSSEHSRRRKEWAAPKIPHQLASAKLSSRSTVKTVAFHRKPFCSGILIWNVNLSSETVEYFASCPGRKRNMPAVTLHSGTDDTSPVLGTAHFRCSHQTIFGIGDPKTDPNGVVWEQMQSSSRWLGRRRFKFEFTDRGKSNAVDSRSSLPSRRHLRWQRTVDPADSADNVTAKPSTRNYRLTDQGDGKVLAVFVMGDLNSVRKEGELRVLQWLSPSLEMAVILTCASISERLRRD